MDHSEVTDQDEPGIVITRNINRVIDSFYAVVVTQSGSRVGFINIKVSGTVVNDGWGNTSIYINPECTSGIVVFN